MPTDRVGATPGGCQRFLVVGSAVGRWGGCQRLLGVEVSGGDAVRLPAVRVGCKAAGPEVRGQIPTGSHRSRPRTISVLDYVATHAHLAVMKSVGVAELKSNLSKHLRAVRRGRALTVLDRSTPVAEIIPYAEGEAEVAHSLPLARGCSSAAAVTARAVVRAPSRTSTAVWSPHRWRCPSRRWSCRYARRTYGSRRPRSA